VVVGTCSDQELTTAATSLAALRHRCLALRLDCVLILQHRGAYVADMSLFGALTRLSIPHAILDVAADRSPASDGAFAPPASRPFGSCIKRGADVMLATALLCALSPLLFGIALLVQHDGGPVFYRQSRVGLGGGLFRCIKFRSMVMDGDARLNELLARDPSAAAEWLASYKLSCDPRVTPLGRILRRTSLDELPQLFNVLRGDMSLVGPRPIVPAELSKYGDATHLYLAVRPGLTGLWQVSGRSDTTYAERVRLDTWYVINWSPWLDLGILLRTIPAVLLRRGAV
jgi:Undecaprenyl-phosphate galactose phosphotransferase WbaP